MSTPKLLRPVVTLWPGLSSRLTRAGLALTTLLWLSAPSHATTLVGMDIDQVAEQAELIFEGEVIARESRREGRNRIINTYVTFAVIDVIAGNEPGDILELKFTGGVFDGQIVEVSGVRIPILGEKGIYFVESTSRDLINPLLGWSQGHYLIVDDEGERRVATADAVPVTDVQSVSDIPRTIRKPTPLIEGDSQPAAGVITSRDPQQAHRALTVDQFKSRIRRIIGN